MAVAAMLAPVGCSLGGDDTPKPVTGVPKEIAITVDRLGRAIADRDFATVCDSLFTASARKRAGGAECAAQLRSAGEDVRHPTIQIRGIDLKGSSASVEVVTDAEGQARVKDTLELRRQDGRWLIEALS
jgi:hypothetical protein